MNSNVRHFDDETEPAPQWALPMWHARRRAGNGWSCGAASCGDHAVRSRETGCRVDDGAEGGRVNGWNDDRSGAQHVTGQVAA